MGSRNSRHRTVSGSLAFGLYVLSPLCIVMLQTSSGYTRSLLPLHQRKQLFRSHPGYFQSPPPPAAVRTRPFCPRKVKNSWGETWGLGGFILLERADSEEDVGGECGLLIEAVYPVLGTPDETPAKPLAAAEVVAVIAQAWEIERPVGFESSAAASDCGGGNSDVVFDSSESCVCARANIFIRAREASGCS